MEDALSRREYPSMLERLQPAAAVSKLNERVKHIGKVNSEIADWLQERRKVEEAYVVGLRKLSKRPIQDVGGDLGIFDAPWKGIVNSIETIASSHATLSERIGKDVEQPLRSFATKNRDMTAMTTIQGNLAAMAKELEDAQDKSSKLSKKGGKASAQKVESAMSRLQSANQQWDSQAPFVFETLQALDETRLNHLRDFLTQYETHEADRIQQNRVTVEQTLGSLLELDTSQEIKNWSQANIAGKPVTERRATRQLSSAGSGSAGGSFGAGSAAAAPPQTPRSTHTDNASETSGRHDEKSESQSKFSKSRFGTMLNRRRASVQGGFNRAPSPSKGGFAPFGGRNSASRDGRPSPSPRTSSNNLREDTSRGRLSSLAESPTSLVSPRTVNNAPGGSAFISDAIPEISSSNAPNGTAGSGLPDLSNVQPPPGPPPSQSRVAAENRKDSDGFTVPGTLNDPISQAEQEAAQEAAQSQFKLDIKKEPIPEQDADAQAALSNVANTLRSSSIGTPSRKVGTVRGRRDVRNTIFVPQGNSLGVASPEHPLPPSPGIVAGRAATLATLSSGERAPSVSDTTSIRSGHSLTNNVPVKHAEMPKPGLNASIVEIMHASIEDGETKSMKISGEISLVYNRAIGDELPASTDIETVRINNFPRLEAIGENRTFIHPVSGEKPDEFTVSLASISPKPVIGFNYRIHLDEANLTSRNPLIIKPTWKPKDDKFDFIIEYSLNPAFSTEPVTFQNLGIIARYTGGRPTACQSKPSGTFKAQQSCVFWRWGELTLTTEPRKLVCRLIVPEGALPVPGHVDAKWEMLGSSAGLSLSRLKSAKDKEKAKEKDDSADAADPFADDDAPPSPEPATPSPSGADWVEIETSRKLVSGRYEARGALKA